MKQSKTMGNMKYKVGDKVRIKSLDWYNENKSKSHGTVACGGKYFDYDMREWCGKIMTILTAYQTCYIMQEDGAKDLWTDEMIECKVEEETKPTCKIDSALNTEKIVLEKVNTLKKQSDNMETETHRGYYTTEEETTNKSKKVAWFTFWDNDFADKVELDLSNRELIQEDGKWFVVKKKKEYPKTFLGCCDAMGIEDTISRGVKGYKSKILDTFQKLLICRDAYWKIAGEEMGLGKPWEPIFDIDNNHFVITLHHGEIEMFFGYTPQDILVFPTAEMRDAFYDNFKKDIEECKELL